MASKKGTLTYSLVLDSKDFDKGAAKKFVIDPHQSVA